MQLYSDHVFVNVPFDTDYAPIFDALLFAILDCGFNPRCARERSNDAEIRIEKIQDFVRESMHGIHDLSRVELSETGLPRFNMPFELGLFLGCRVFGGKKHFKKRALILDSEPYRYQKFISDIAGQDPSYHHNKPEEVITCVRNWLSESTEREIPSARFMAKRYYSFQTDLPKLCQTVNWHPEELTYKEFLSLATSWLRNNTQLHLTETLS